MFGFLRRRQFRDLVQTQLALFDAEHAELVQRARAERSRYDATHDPQEALERYAAHDDLSDDVETLLYEMCERYAATIDEPRQRTYVAEFDRQARRRYGDLIPRLSFPSSDDETGEPLGPQER